MKDNFSRITIIALILALAAATVLYAQSEPTKSAVSNTTPLYCNAQPEHQGAMMIAQAPKDGSGGPDSRRSGGRVGKRRGGGQKGHMEMFKIFQKYVSNPEFKKMLNAQEAMMDKQRNAMIAQRKKGMKEIRNLMLKYAAKANAAKSENEKSLVISEMEQKFKATMDKAKNSSMRRKFESEMKAFESRYKAKFPDYFKFMEKMKSNRRNRRGGRSSGGRESGGQPRK